MFREFQLVLCVGSVYGYMKSSSFERVESLDNKQPFFPSLFSRSILLSRCALECNGNSLCKFFTHNEETGLCKTSSYIRFNVNLEHHPTKIGNQIFGKYAVCGIPEGLTSVKLIHVEGLESGSRATFTCEDYFYPTIVTCDASGSWLGLSTACKPLPSSGSRSIPADGSILEGRCFALTATPTENTFFEIRLFEETDLNLWISSTFDKWGLLKVIRRNSRLNGQLPGPTQTDIPYWPFQVGREFNMTICAEDTKYRAIVDGEEIFTYTYYSPPSKVQRVLFDGDQSIRSVHFLGL